MTLRPHHTHSDLVFALNNPDQTDPLALAVTLAIQEYTRQINATTERTGRFPDTVTVTAPRTEIEAFALETVINGAAKAGLTFRIEVTEVQPVPPAEPIMHPITMLPVYADLIDGGLADIRTNLANLKAIHAEEYGTLDDHTAQRFVNLYTDGLELLPVNIQQLDHWNRSELTGEQRKEVARLAALVPLLKDALTEGLSIANEMADRTIEKVMAMSDEELGMLALLRMANRRRT